MGSPLPLWASLVQREKPLQTCCCSLRHQQGQGHSPKMQVTTRTCVYYSGMEQLRNLPTEGSSSVWGTLSSCRTKWGPGVMQNVLLIRVGPWCVHLYEFQGH